MEILKVEENVNGGGFLKINRYHLKGAPHPFEILDKPDASVIAIFSEDKETGGYGDKMFLITELRLGVRNEKGELGGYEHGSVGGIADKDGESAIDLAIREVAEETGFDTSLIKNVKSYGAFYPSCGCSSERVHLFSCTIPEDAERNFVATSEGEEIIDWKWVHIAEAEDLITSMSSTIILEKVRNRKLLEKIAELV